MQNKAFSLLLTLFILLVVGTAAHTKDPGGEPQDFDSLWDYQDPATTEATFRDLVDVAKASGDTSYYGQLLTQIARTEGLQGRFEDAHETLDLVDSLMGTRVPIVRIRYLLERGRVLNSSGEREEAKCCFLEAWGLSLEHGEEYHAIDALHMMGIVTPPDEQLVWSERAMEKCERTADQRAQKWLGPLYNNIGWTYHDLGLYEKALSLFEKSLAWRLEQEDEHGARIAKWTIGRAFRSLDRIDEAVDIQRALEREIHEKGLDEDGYVYEELAENLKLKGEEAEAELYFAKAYRLLSQDQWMVENEAERLGRLKELGGE